MPHLCWTFHLLILKLVKKELIQQDRYLFFLPPVQGIPSLPLSHITCHIRYHVSAWSAVCVCVSCVGMWQVSQWPAQRNITLPGWYQPCDPGASFIATEITYYWFMTPDPRLEILLVTSLMHTDRHTHLSLTSCEKSLYKWHQSLSGLPGYVWSGCVAALPKSSVSLALIQAVAKQYYICKVNGTGQTIWYGRLTMRIYAGSRFLLAGG